MIFLQTETVASPLVEYGALGVVTASLLGVLFWLIRYITTRFTAQNEKTVEVIAENTEVIRGTKEALEISTRQSGELSTVLAEATQVKTNCQGKITELSVATAQCLEANRLKQEQAG